MHATVSSPVRATSSRLPARLRRAISLGVRARRSASVADATGVYTAANTPTVYRLSLGSIELERAVDLLTGAERDYYRAAFTATDRKPADNVRARMAARYRAALEEARFYGDDTRTLRHWLRTSFLRPRVKVAGNTLGERLGNLLASVGGGA